MIRSAASKVMWVGRATVFLIGLAVVLGLLFRVAATALAGTGVGATFNLGQANTVNKISSLIGSATSAMLKIDNNGTGPALNLQTQAGKAPITVNATAGKATNLNADRVDGLNASALQGPRAYAHVNADGTIDTASSKNVPTGDVSTSGGFYCFSGLGFTPKNVVATLDPGAVLTDSEIATTWVRLGALGCDPGTQVSVLITQSGQGFEARNFFVVFN